MRFRCEAFASASPPVVVAFLVISVVLWVLSVVVATCVDRWPVAGVGCVVGDVGGVVCVVVATRGRPLLVVGLCVFLARSLMSRE